MKKVLLVLMGVMLACEVVALLMLVLYTIAVHIGIEPPPKTSSKYQGRVTEDYGQAMIIYDKANK